MSEVRYIPPSLTLLPLALPCSVLELFIGRLARHSVDLVVQSTHKAAEQIVTVVLPAVAKRHIQ